MALLKGFPPSNLISPSVRIAEKDLSFIAPDQSSHRAGIVGFASKGPVNRPTLITTTRQLHTIFGWPHPDTGDPYLIYAAEQYLLVGSELYVVRVAETSPVNDEAAATAYVTVPTAGGVVQVIGNVSVGSGFSFAEDTFFRWKLNGNLSSKILVVLSDDNRPSPDTGTAYTMADLVDALNDQLDTSIDGIEFSFNNANSSGAATSTSKLVLSTTFSYGTDASVELVSVKDSLYGPSSVVGMGTTMTAASVTGSRTQYPDTSIPTPGTYNFSSFSSGSLNLQIVVDGTNNSLIDNVVQTVTLSSSVLTATQISNAINTAVSNGTVPGGFTASVSSNSIKLTTDHVGRDAKILVKSTSTADALLGLANTTATGTSPSAVSGGGATYAAGIVTGSANSAGTTCFTVYAESPGIEGNETQIVVTNQTSEGTFTLDVYNNGEQVESWGRLTKDQTSTYYVETYIAQVSNYITVTDNTATGALPAASTLSSPYSLSGGLDGIPADPDDQDDLLVGDDVAMTGLQALGDPEQIDIDLVIVPGHTSTAVVSGVLDFCQNKRGDCFSIIDSPFGLSVTEVVQWQNGVHPLNDTRFDSDFGALYWPWVKLRDSFNKINVWCPPSGSVLAAYARSDTIAAPWIAPAGLTRGLVPNITDTFTQPTRDERDSMYMNRNAVNPITQFAGQDGFYLWGQKTLQRLPSALDRVNVRRMLLWLEKRVQSGARTLLFEPHTALLRKKFVDMATTFLSQLRRAAGLTNFIVKCDDELNTQDVIDRNELRARIGVQPTRAVEFIFIEFSVHRTGSFAENTEF